MSYHYPGLFARGRLFYFRVRIPACLRLISRCDELSYSLGTSIYQEAIEKYHVEFAHLQAFLTILKEIIMKVNEDKKVVLDEADVDKLLLHRLEQIQAFLENNAEEIKAKRKTAADIILFPNGQKEADIRKLMTDMLIDYLKGLIDKNKANITLRTVYSQLKNKEIELGLAGEDDKYDWLKSFSTHINQLDHYAKKAIETERDEKTYTPRSAKVVSLLRTYDAMKTDERIHKSMSATHWEKFFKRYAAMKKHLKDSTQRCLYDNYLGVKLAFSLIDKEYVEDVTRQDCRTLCEKIYRVPRRWHQELTENKTVLDILRSDSNSQTLSKQTIKKHLGTFKEFMRYAVKEEIIPNSLNEFIDMPIKSDRKERKPFTNNELKKIFNPKNYPNPHLRNNQAKFWIPLIALYHGCRSNEICQLDVADIVREKNIPCISINNDGKDKSVKNRGSKRIIPIHPRILKMGFLYYVEYQRKNKQKKLFSELTYRKETGYAAIIQHWFARYLDSIDIKSPSSVFHSFRHTFETKAVEQRIPAEYQNAICGWTDQGIGQRLYAHKKDIRIMLEEISKINYPINSELKELQKSFMDSFVIRQLGAKE
ncbi:MAG: site-specific integrase [Alphaproteobacteria bacterium]|nr:site-specific integrase [Alphaproteobacteria bacterium]